MLVSSSFRAAGYKEMVRAEEITYCGAYGAYSEINLMDKPERLSYFVTNPKFVH